MEPVIQKISVNMENFISFITEMRAEIKSQQKCRHSLFKAFIRKFLTKE